MMFPGFDPSQMESRRLASDIQRRHRQELHRRDPRRALWAEEAERNRRSQSRIWLIGGVIGLGALSALVYVILS